MPDIIIKVIIFLAGNVSGYVIHSRLLAKSHLTLEEKQRMVFGDLILLAFTVSLFLDMASADYSTPLEFYGVAGIILGALFGEKALRRIKQKDNEPQN